MEKLRKSIELVAENGLLSVTVIRMASQNFHYYYGLSMLQLFSVFGKVIEIQFLKIIDINTQAFKKTKVKYIQH